MFRGKDNRHVVSIHDFSKDDILDFVDITQRIKENHAGYSAALKGKRMARLFYSASTRTFETHGEAMRRLGGQAELGFRSTEGTSAKKGESLASTLRMYQRYGADVIVLRHPRDGSARYATDIVNGPWIINGGDGNNEHPTQNMMDIFTINEKQGRLDGLTVIFFGDLRYGRTTRLVYPLSLFDGNRFVFLAHPAVSMPEHVKEYLRNRNVEFDEFRDPKIFPDLVHEADIAYGSRNQEERWPREGTTEGDLMRREVINSVVLTKAVIKRACPRENFMVMHPLPRDMRAPCITDDVKETPYCWYDEQAENGVYARMGILYSQFHDWWLDE